MRVRHPSIYMKTSEQTAFPGENTGVMRYDTAQLGSTRNHVTDFAAAVLPVPSGYWSIFALLSSAEDHHPANHGAVRLDDDAQTGMPWARYAGHTSTLLAFFDSETRVLRIANTGAGRAFLGRRVGNDYECEEIAGSGTAQYFEPERSRVIEVDELVDEGVFPLRSSLDASSVEVQSVEIRDGDFLVLGSDSTWVGLSGNEAVQAVSAWMREQEAPPPPKAPGRSRRWPQDPFQDFPWDWKDHEDGRLSWVRAMIPAMIWDVDDMFMAAARENPASRILQRTVTEHRGESRRIAPERDHNMSVCPEHSVSNRE
ncbi:hypothetical protein B0F90DRAFT_1758022 [Multifurca ochricompacta]|uniref:Uncharacterized protein n=1 Tax=Multifurca ochricompacta TaxID=376703 RepID=A0AAD4QJ94_9AGAM|nr:hypothetical protein B0F90DRAFT_1758022 [Multifurca ochricompacta]